MKKTVFFTPVIALAMLITSCGPAGSGSEGDAKKDKKEKSEKAEKVSMKVDTKNSTVNWSGTLVGVYTHRGTVKIKDGKFTARGNRIKGGKFSVDLTTIAPTDDNFNPEEGNTRDKLTNHLMSDDFFDVEKHPAASFEITSHDVKAGTITGKLTVRGNTDEEVIENVEFNPETGVAKGVLTFDRQKYDVAFAHPAEDMVISDDIKVEITIKGKKAEA